MFCFNLEQLTTIIITCNDGNLYIPNDELPLVLQNRTSYTFDIERSELISLLKEGDKHPLTIRGIKFCYDLDLKPVVFPEILLTEDVWKVMYEQQSSKILAKKAIKQKRKELEALKMKLVNEWVDILIPKIDFIVAYYNNPSSSWKDDHISYIQKLEAKVREIKAIDIKLDKYFVMTIMNKVRVKASARLGTTRDQTSFDFKIT